MSENPYVTKVPSSPTGAAMPPNSNSSVPTGTQVFTVISLVLGIMGLLGVFAGLAGLLFNNLMTGQIIENLPADDPSRILQEKMLAAQEGFLIPQIILQLMNLFVAGGLTLGAIMTLNRKPTGPGLLMKAFLAAIVFVLIRLALTTFMQIRMKPALSEAFAQSTGPEAEMIKNVTEASFIVGIVIGAVVAIAMAAYYFMAYRNFMSESAQRYFATFK